MAQAQGPRETLFYISVFCVFVHGEKSPICRTPVHRVLKTTTVPPTPHHSTTMPSFQCR